MPHYTWVNVTYSKSFDSFRVCGTSGYCNVLFSGFMPPSQGAVKSKVLINMYTSRPVSGGGPVIRVKIVDRVVRQFIMVETPTDDMFPGEVVTQIDSSDDDDVNDSLARAFSTLDVNT